MSPDRKRSSLATTASDQVRSIIEAAEQTAAEIRAEAEREAERIRREAEEDASGIRTQASGDVRELFESIRDGVRRLGAELEELEGKLQPSRPPAIEPERPPAVEPESEPAPASTSAEEPDPDAESARLVALNMALDGASREDVDRYLSENFAVSDRKTLLDDVYASIGS